MGSKPSSQSKPTVVSTNTTPAAKRHHVRKPLMELLAVKLETSLETMTQLGHFAKSCAGTADARFKPILDQLATAADSLGAATKTTLANYVKLVDGKFTPPETVRAIRPAGLTIGDRVTIINEFAPRYESFTPWRGCSSETLQVVHIEGSEYLLRRPNGSDVYVRSPRHLSRVS